MRDPAEYRQHASECRKLALNARNEQERSQLTAMAEAWERMALERERQTTRYTAERSPNWGTT